MRILIAYRAIDNIAGGVERISIGLMNEMVTRGHEVHFFTLDAKDARSFYPMNPKITWHKLGIGDPAVKASWGTRFKRARVGRALIKDIRPDVIVGFQENAFMQMHFYSRGLDIPVVLAERIAPSHFDHKKSGLSKKISFKLYKRATKITVQSASYLDAYPEILREKITVIHNPVYAAPGRANPAGTPGQQKILLCVGRICRQKNQTALIEAFARLHNEHPEWVLHLAGDEEDGSPRIAAKKLGLEGKVKFLGAVHDVGALYASSHLFCLPSRWEGFPNALAEAMSYGLPAVGYIGCDGVNVLIEHLKTGLLAAGNGNIQSLQTMLSAAMEDAHARTVMGIAAIESVRRYEPRVIFDQWEQFLKLARDA